MYVYIVDLVIRDGGREREIDHCSHMRKLLPPVTKLAKVFILDVLVNMHQFLGHV